MDANEAGGENDSLKTGEPNGTPIPADHSGTTSDSFLTVSVNKENKDSGVLRPGRRETCFVDWGPFHLTPGMRWIVRMRMEFD